MLLNNDTKLSLNDIKASKNVALLLTKDELSRIADEVVRGYEIDEESRSGWNETIREAMDIAMQIMEDKDFPWENASNVKYPLITQASIDYASRTIPEVVQNDKIVKINVIGVDKSDDKYKKAERVSKFMSYDLTTRAPDWVDGTDKLLQILPVLGTVFKKSYYDEVEKRNCSDLCVPDKIVINYGTQSLETARRVTHLLKFYLNDVITRQRKGMYLEKDSSNTAIDIRLLMSDLEGGSLDDADRPLVFLEQHCYLDLDGDGYREPYVVTLEKSTKQIFRIYPRFKSIELTGDGKVIRIVPKQYFTDFHFIRSPDGGFYSMGFGSLLLPLNKAINTLINQLIDSGTLNNMQGGVIGKGIRLKNGELKFKMGRWQCLDVAAGEDIAKNIYPWPTKEPSQTLYQLLGMLMQVGKNLSSTTDVLQGNQPAQNVASSTVAQLVEQGVKVFVAINKRLYRSLKKEYQKLFDLNGEYLTQKEYMNVLDDPEADVKKDFNDNNLDIAPVADPSISTESQRIYKAGMIQQLRTVDPREADRLFLQAMQVDPDMIDKLLPPPPENQEPPPDVQKIMAEIQQIQVNMQAITAQANTAAQKLELDRQKFVQDMKESESRIIESQARVWKAQQDAAHNIRKDNITATKMTSQEDLKAAQFVHKTDVDSHSAQLSEVELAAKIAKDASDRGDNGKSE